MRIKIKKTKYGANIWIHNFDYDTASHWGCTGALAHSHNKVTVLFFISKKSVPYSQFLIVFSVFCGCNLQR